MITKPETFRDFQNPGESKIWVQKLKIEMFEQFDKNVWLEFEFELKLKFQRPFRTSESEGLWTGNVWVVANNLVGFDLQLVSGHSKITILA